MVRSRDPRFDGLFFFGVRTTGVYCRPVCPARTPLAAHCMFFEHAAQAEQAGFRPCLRCRPELAPRQGPSGQAVAVGAGLLHRALLALDTGGLLADGVQPAGIRAVAQRLGVSDRHLRRVFMQAMGVTPQAYVQTRRLLMAKRLLTDTPLPVIEVAAIAGFGSLRRFNASWRHHYDITPTQLRRRSLGEAARAERITRTSAEGGAGDPAQQAFVFRLSTRPPFDPQALMAFFRRRQVDGLEAISPHRMRRGLVLQDVEGVALPGWIEVIADGSGLGAGLTLRVSPSLAPVIPGVLDRVERAFDLSCRPETVAQVLGSLAIGYEGLRIPGALDGFEVAVRALVGQQITVTQATRRVTALVQRFGRPIDSPWPEVNRAFPCAATIAEQPFERMSEVIQHRGRARALQALAQEVLAGRLSLAPTSEIESTLAALKRLPGVGEWTAQYIALRALGWPDAFPESDAGLLRAMGTRNPRQARQWAESWRPFRGYAAMHLWHHEPRPLAP